MNNELERVLNFEGNEIKVKTDKGVELFNLANSARVLGLTRKDNNRNTERIRWTGNASVKEKLNIVCGTDMPQQYIEELNQLLIDIDEIDDRNNLFMSRYLTSRLAMKCNNEKANKYQDWLAKLDLSYSKGELTLSQQDLSNLVSNTVNNIIPSLVKSVTEQFIPIINETEKQIKEAKEQVKQMNEKLGMRNRNTQIIGKRLINRECEFYGRRIWGNSLKHRLNKTKLFNHFRVLSLDDISINRFDEVCDYVDSMELIDIKQINEYKLSSKNKNSYIHEVKIS